MVSCGQYKMMPMAPTSIMAMASSSKPKIGFSIDSIVGNSDIRGGSHTQRSSLSPRSETSERPSSPLSDCGYPLELRNHDIHQRGGLQISDCTLESPHLRLSRIHQMMSNDFHRNFTSTMNSQKFAPGSPGHQQQYNNPSSNHHNHENGMRPQTPVSLTTSSGSSVTVNAISQTSLPPIPTTPPTTPHQKHSSICSNSPTLTLSGHTRLSPDEVGRKLARTPSPPAAHHQANAKGPIVVPGIPAGLVRPFPVQPPNLGEMKSMHPYMNSPEVVGPPNPHFLAAQFQMAAALAHGQAGQGFPPGAGIPQHHSQFTNPNMVRESYPLYPWLLSRHGRIFPHRFPGNFLLQPFRKPKRVRTAFSPSQLLKLEHAFENNHYVVGAERKTLAQALNLTETQVKVWFQNRRTKHKRMQQEEDAKSGGNGGNSNNNQKNDGDNNGSQISYDEDEDELIDMDDCPSDDDSDLVP